MTVSEGFASTVRLEHGDRFSSVILTNDEADMWCEVCRWEGSNRVEATEYVFNCICAALLAEQRALENVG